MAVLTIAHYSEMFLIQFQGTTTAASKLDALYSTVRNASQEEVETAYECEVTRIEDVRAVTNPRMRVLARHVH